MTDKIMMDGKPLEVGDEVYSLYYGHGEVDGIDKGQYPIIVIFDDETRVSFTRDLKLHANDLTRNLYWQKPNIVPPPKPKKNEKVCDWFIEWEIDDHQKPIVDRVNGLSESALRDAYPGALIQKIDGTEREVCQ